MGLVGWLDPPEDPSAGTGLDVAVVVGRSVRGRGRDVLPPAPPWLSEPAPVRPGQGLLRLRPSRGAVAHMAHDLAVRPSTGLAAALGAHKADPAAALRPVDWVIVVQLGLDQHGEIQDSALGGGACPGQMTVEGRGHDAQSSGNLDHGNPRILQQGLGGGDVLGLEGRGPAAGAPAGPTHEISRRSAWP